MYITTRSGRQIDVFQIKPDDIDIFDIAYSLSNLCRFGGHTDGFYSVAQHSVRVALYLPLRSRFVGLMHDATECYLCDLPRPIKQRLPAYKVIEEYVWQAVAKRFDLPAIIPEDVHRADNIALVTEYKELMPPGVMPIEMPKEILDATPLVYERPASHHLSRFVFLSCFRTYCGDRKLQEAVQHALHSD